MSIFSNIPVNTIALRRPCAARIPGASRRYLYVRHHGKPDLFLR
jgi:hypothetical protein